MALVSTLARAGIKRNKGSFLGLFFLMALTSTVLCFTVGMYVDLNERETDALAEVGAGDVYAYDLPSNFTDDVADEIKALDDVGEVRTSDALRIPTQFLSDSSSIDKNATAPNFYVAWDKNFTYKVLTSDGKSFEENPTAPGVDELYAPISWKTTPGVELGDEVRVAIDDEERLFTIKGFYEDPQLGTPFMEIKRACINPTTFNEFLQKADKRASEQTISPDAFYTSLGLLRLVEVNISLNDEAKAAGLSPQDLTRTISENTEWGATTSGMFSSTTLASYSMIVIIIGTAIMGVFALLLFGVALVICAHSINTSIEENYADYGTLKALGITHQTLSRTLVIEYASVSFAGLCAGLLLSFFLVPPALPFFAQLTGVLAVHKGITPVVLICIATLTLLVVGIVACKARKLARISPLKAFRGGSSDVHFMSRLARPITDRCLNLQLALRALVSAKRRYVGLLTCAVFLCAFIVLVFGVGGTFGAPGAALSTFSIWKSDVSVCLQSDDVTKDDIERVITEHGVIAKSWQESFKMVNLDGESRSFVGLSDLSIIENISDGRAPKLDNEVVIGPNLAHAMGLEVGDEFVITVGESERTLLITGLISGMFNAGYGSILTYDGFCKVFDKDPDDPLVGFQYALENPDDADEVRQALEAEFGESIDAQPTGLFSNTTDLVALIQSLFVTLGYSMTVVAAALAFLAVSLITGRMFSAERHDLGVYRALGFTSRMLRLQFALRFFLVSFVGSTLGSAMAMLGGGWLVGQLFGMFGVTHFELGVAPVLVCALTIGFAVVFFIAAYISARAIKRINVRELIVE